MKSPSKLPQKTEPATPSRNPVESIGNKDSAVTGEVTPAGNASTKSPVGERESEKLVRNPTEKTLNQGSQLAGESKLSYYDEEQKPSGLSSNINVAPIVYSPGHVKTEEER